MRNLTDDNGEAPGRRLNWRQACEILGCSKSHFYRLVRSGRLPAYKIQGVSRGMWFYESDCLRLLECVGKNHS